MSLKSKILQKLLTDATHIFSATELSENTVSRNAVWKAVRALQEKGYPILNIAGKGYTFGGAVDFPLAEDIEKLTNGKFSPAVVWQTASTNTDLRRLAEEGAPHGTTLIACRQNGGRGRMGRSFFSEAGGLYLSLLLRPQTTAERGGDITGVAAVAVAEAIEAVTGKRAYIKWVNDIFCGGKKVCGILTDAAVSLEGGLLSYAVLGIGLNVYSPKDGFPQEIRDIAGALYPHGDTKAGLINRLAAEVLCRFDSLYQKPDEALDGYKRRCFLIGQQVTAVRGNEEQPVRVLDVAEDYSLLVEDQKGEKKLLNSGEVRVRPEEVPV
ncbi:MAG: biotin--[Clostridia bacterium]|nr:biotin--[acetyl-CoA-carboxylase] ligase [Clostridia bacterium]